MVWPPRPWLFGWQADDGSMGSDYAHVGNLRLPFGMTPGGVGAKRTPPLWMKDGDTVEVEITGIGTLVNPIVAET